MNTKWIFPMLALLAISTPGFATNANEEKIRQLVDNLKWQQGAIPLEDAATITPSGYFRYLNGTDSSWVLSELWGNPPHKTLGMLFPDYKGPLDSAWAVIIEGFEKEGFVKDADADKLDAPALLKQMQDAQKNGNEERKKRGFAALELVGWAVPPHYDKAAKKLYWALDIKAIGSSRHSVNYYVRVLGRRGYLVLNAVGSMESIPAIEAATPKVLSMVEFNAGHRYADFDSKTDKVATYGIAGLIAGAIGLKLAAKAGLLALFATKFGPLLLIFKKGLIVIVAAVAALFKKFKGLFGGNKESST